MTEKTISMQKIPGSKTWNLKWEGGSEYWEHWYKRVYFIFIYVTCIPPSSKMGSWRTFAWSVSISNSPHWMFVWMLTEHMWRDVCLWPLTIAPRPAWSMKYLQRTDCSWADSYVSSSICVLVLTVRSWLNVWMFDCEPASLYMCSMDTSMKTWRRQDHGSMVWLSIRQVHIAYTCIINTPNISYNKIMHLTVFQWHAFTILFYWVGSGDSWSNSLFPPASGSCRDLIF